MRDEAFEQVHPAARAVDPCRRIRFVFLGVHLYRQTDLPKIARADCPFRLAAGLGKAGKENRDKHGDHRDHDQKFDEGEGAAPAPTNARRLGMGVRTRV
jgi:hypothetical protein